ncbi:hypothetical protein KC19_2G186500 [Ceratodon purpureus]|uniref:Uncharacterized protein n=1 Tax=Ceratodon purpureus TaxID=3225 RepID=A0A8T0IWZ7_CERPU|nr:hypothetical protein KC19_2G186500 [Ceratodon purpureus]
MRDNQINLENYCKFSNESTMFLNQLGAAVVMAEAGAGGWTWFLIFLASQRPRALSKLGRALL